MRRALPRGRVDIILPDGRHFRSEAAEPGHVAELRIHDPDLFARLIREGDLGFCDSYLDGGWSTPDLQAFMDLIHADNEGVYDGFPGMALVRAYDPAANHTEKPMDLMFMNSIAASATYPPMDAWLAGRAARVVTARPELYAASGPAAAIELAEAIRAGAAASGAVVVRDPEGPVAVLLLAV